MGSGQLDDKTIEDILKALEPTEVQAESDAYEPSSNIRKDYTDELKEAAGWQELDHKERLMNVVSFLAIGSFILLLLIVAAQMTVRYFHPEYLGVSDDVVKVIAVSVFGQVIVVVGALATYLFKKKP